MNINFAQPPTPDYIGNVNDIYNRYEEIMNVVLEKNNMHRHQHETAIVIMQINETQLIVAPRMNESEQLEQVACLYNSDGYRPGDLVLIQYINSNAHHKMVIGVIRRGAEDDMENLEAMRDRPVRVFRSPHIAFHDPRHIVMGIECPPPELIHTIVYAEDTPGEWKQRLHRGVDGRVRSVETVWPQGMGGITEFIVHFPDGTHDRHGRANEWFHYYGEDPNPGFRTLP